MSNNRWAWRSNRLALVAVVIMVLVAVAVWLQAQDGDEAGVPDDASLTDAAPAFSLPAVGGETVSLADFSGKNVLLYFSMGHG